MKKITLLLFIATTLCFAQKVEKIEITPTGVNGFIVKEFKGLNNDEIYSKLKKWIEYNIKNPDFSVKNDVENEYIAFKISKVGKVEFEKHAGLWTLSLKVELRIKDEKLRIDIVELNIDGENEASPILISASGLTPSIYRKGKVRRGYNGIKNTVNSSLNNFANELQNSINGNPDYKKDDW